MNLEGIITALATPFLNGEVDTLSLTRLLNLQIKQNISGLVINGTTGESPCLTSTEVKHIFKTAKSATKNNIPLIVGVGGSSTEHTLHNIQQASKWQAFAVLAVVPYYNKPPQRGLVQHFTTLAERSPLPVILYNVPARTVTNLTIESIKQLKHLTNIQGIKEASGDMSFGRQVIKQTTQVWKVFSGDDESVMDLCAQGAHGGICVLSHIAGAAMQQMFQKIKKHDKHAHVEYKQKYGPLLKALYAESNPIGIKAALKLMGIFRSNEMRSPLAPFTQNQTTHLKKHLKQAGFL